MISLVIYLVRDRVCIVKLMSIIRRIANFRIIIII